MKQTFILMTAALLAVAVSCRKAGQDMPAAVPGEDPVFTASIGGTRTSLDASTGKVSWDGDEEVIITDASDVSVVYVVASVSGGNATLVKKEGETGTLGAGPYTAVYGPESLQAQADSRLAGEADK